MTEYLRSALRFHMCVSGVVEREILGSLWDWNGFEKKNAASKNSGIETARKIASKGGGKILVAFVT